MCYYTSTFKYYVHVNLKKKPTTLSLSIRNTTLPPFSCLAGEILNKGVTPKTMKMKVSCFCCQEKDVKVESFVPPGIEIPS